MYTSYIGKKFLKIYRERYDKPDDYSARQFFDEVQFPLFFQDDYHLMHVGNSPFFQKPRDEDVKLHGGKSLAQLNNLRKKVDSGVPSGSMYVGFGAEEVQATSSGQLTSMDFKIDEEEIYASWSGEAFGIGVSGAFVMLIDKEAILLSLFQGWQYYRKYVEQTPKLKDKQIETWNGQWITHAFSKKFDSDNPLDNFQVETTEVLGKLAIPTQKWSQVLFSLSRKYPNKTLTVYAYSLSQTNTTLGFINIYVPEILRLYELRDKIFINQTDVILKDEEIEKLETFFNFKSACKFGTIGLKALEPAKIREFMPKGSVAFAQGNDFKFSDENSFLFFQLYKLWIIAMLNKTELLKLASDVAKGLIDSEASQSTREQTKKVGSQTSKDLMESKTIKTFIDGLAPIMTQENAHAFKSVVEEILKMPSDNFPLFATLIRFEYNFQKINSSKQAKLF